MSKILFFGDSITFGEYDGVFGGYADILKRYSHTKFLTENTEEVTVYNLGIPGETTESLIKRIDTELKSRISDDRSAVFLFYGANDLAKKEGNHQVSLDNFSANISDAVKNAQKYGSDVYLIGLVPISERINDVVTSTGKKRSQSDIIIYNSKIKAIAETFSVNYVDLNLYFEDKTEEFISIDGVHPNAKGYRLIAEILKPLLEIYF